MAKPMTEAEKEIALLRHEANRLRLFGRPTASKVLADKADELSRVAVTRTLTAEASTCSLYWCLARFIHHHPAGLFEALCEDGRPIYAPSDVVASEVARMVAHHPESVPVGTWVAIHKVASNLKCELALLLPLTTDVDFVVSFLEGKIHAAKP